MAPNMSNADVHVSSVNEYASTGVHKEIVVSNIIEVNTLFAFK